MTGLRQAKKLALRRRIVDVSLRRFVTDGYDETTVEQICAEVGIGKATFFRYFNGKSDVLSSSGQAAFESLTKLAPVDADAPLDSALKQWYGRVRQTIAANPAVTRAMLEARAMDPFRPDEVGHVKTRNFPAELIASAVERGALRPLMPPVDLARLLEGMAYATIAMWAENPERSAAGPDLETTVDLFLTGCSAS